MPNVYRINMWIDTSWRNRIVCLVKVLLSLSNSLWPNMMMWSCTTWGIAAVSSVTMFIMLWPTMKVLRWGNRDTESFTNFHKYTQLWSWLAHFSAVAPSSLLVVASHFTRTIPQHENRDTWAWFNGNWKASMKHMVWNYKKSIVLATQI